jgi:hypothetical protein
MSSSDSAGSIVRESLKAAGLAPLEEEVVAFIETYPHLRAQADRLHLLAAGDVDPALIYQATGPDEQRGRAIR